jgi:hypothetical protein
MESLEMVSDWLALDEVAERLALSVGQVRRLVREGSLVAVSVPGLSGPQVPALFLADGQIVKGLTGTLTLLHDARYTPGEALSWLFTPDDSLSGRPIDVLRANRGTEVRRRAQALL